LDFNRFASGALARTGTAQSGWQRPPKGARPGESQLLAGADELRWFVEAGEEWPIPSFHGRSKAAGKSRSLGGDHFPQLATAS
jgi:hypothetical protein